MDDAHFDRISRFFANCRLSRRQAIASTGAGIVTGLAGGGMATVAAQDATPAPGADRQGPEMLFVQSFQAGSIAPVEGADGRYAVTLDHGLGQTVYFSDRPDRIVGATPTADFLDGLGFSADNPPNAALVVETAPGETDLAVVELFNPVYDAASATLTYEVATLANWEDATDLGFTEAPADLAALAATFGAAHVFIDGCSAMDMDCFNLAGTRNTVGVIPSSDFGGLCYNATDNVCEPCKPWFDSYDEASKFWAEQCTVRWPDKCGSEGCGFTYIP